MAYMNKETATKIRKAIKETFKGIKFSITVENHSTLHVKIMESNLFDNGVEFSYLHRDSSYLTEEQKVVVNKLHDIIREVGKYYNNSDSHTDYFDCAFYYYVGVGKWNKKHVSI